MDIQDSQANVGLFNNLLSGGYDKVNDSPKQKGPNDIPWLYMLPDEALVGDEP